MQTRLLRLRFRRRLKKGQRQVEDLGSQAEEQIEQHLFKRINRLGPIRRFVFGWIGLLVLLISALVAQNILLSGYYQTLQPVPGGVYNEGVIGRFTNANPIYANSEADLTVSKLIFAGLLSFNNKGNLVGDLAKDFKVDSHGNVTIHLRPHLTWQDGKPLTSADVVFTYQLIQNPDAQSPLQSSWKGVTVTAVDPQTVIFKLPGVLASFPYNLTNGIVPKHLLEHISPADLRSAEFNTVNPIGAGPFAWQAVEVSGNGNPKTAQQKIALKPFISYGRGKPKLQKFVVQVFASEDQVTQAFKNKQLTGIDGLSEVPHQLVKQKGIIKHNLPLRAATMVFFKTSNGVLADPVVRQALVQSADVPDIIKRLDYPARPVREPLLLGQVGYDPALAQAKLNLKASTASLQAAGWQMDKQGIFKKDNKPLTFTLTAANSKDAHMVAGQLQKQWRQLGVKLNIQFLDDTDFQNAITTHGYEAVLNGISIGIDPDVFVYWDSSQADIRSANRLNLSEYKNTSADASLEAGRIRLDPNVRIVKYKPFLQAWQKDAPALGLYQPRALYLTNGAVSGLDEHPVNHAIERLINVHNWKIREAKVTN